MEQELKDKKLYSYKRALNQPYWIQRLNDRLSLDAPIKFSLLVYFLLVFALLYVLLDVLFKSFPFGLKGMFASMVAFYAARILSDLVVDGKALIFYIIDYLKFYVMYGLKSDRIYINKGIIYEKHKKRKEND
ncbi:TcpE family conjugal transfer membrane protein [Streptococcus cristatus]|uniref:TcpE family conjugal transfer membrane protein n=1 Tax=Streptococcus cristatus TaxID=45634 RepID=UPI0028D42DF5|nr:TcpE family conjugal transfer membrane protein [Streptococcus cristatus]